MPVALALAAPVLLFALWYCWAAWAEFDRYRRASDDPVTLDAELYHIFLHDQLLGDLRHLTLPDRPEDSQLPMLSLSLDAAELEEGNYVDALIQDDGAVQHARVRYRGSRHWHRLGRQKSLKVRLDRGELVDGVRVFSLLNDVTPFGLEEELVLELARKRGLLTPEYRPVWVRLNNADMGVYRFEAQPDEGLLRRARRMPGSIYSGDAKGTGAEGALFAGLAGWEKVGWKSEEEEKDLTELERLLEAVGHADHPAFARFADTALDVDRFARLDALDVVFGSEQHDWTSDHKLYFDPYRGRFEPIAWNFQAFKHRRVFHMATNPLRIRLQMLPDYNARVDREVYDLLVGDASPTAIRARADQRFAQLLPDLRADPYWDAYKLLPRASRFHRFMVRPMSAGDWLLAAQNELIGFSRRSRYLLDLLEQPGLALQGRAMGDRRGVVDVRVDGHAAYDLTRVGVSGGCAGTWELWADLDLSGALDPERDVLLAAGPMGETAALARGERLVPGVRLDALHDPGRSEGPVRVEREARTYRFFVATDTCPPTSAALDLESVVLGSSLRPTVVLEPAGPAAAPAAAGPLAAVPALQAGERSPHPWAFPRTPETEEIRLGPGTVSLASSVTFEPHQTVRIAAGTRIELGPDAALVLRGPLHVEGSRAHPVEIVDADPAHPHGIVALQGPGTAGSRIAGLRLTGGHCDPKRPVLFPGALDVHDTSDVLMRDIVVAGGTDCEDALHATYVQGLDLQEIEIRDAPVDAIDLEFSTARIRGAHVVDPGDECLDLMGSTVNLTDSVLVGSPTNAISAGEETHLTVHSVLVSRSKVAVLAKNASEVRISRSLIQPCETALRTNRRDVYYAGPSRITADELFAVGCDVVARRADGTTIEAGRVHEALYEGALDHLRTQVLGLGDWQQAWRPAPEAAGP